LKILTVVGARPQFVKAAVVSKAISAIGSISEIIVHTGQHYDNNLSSVFFNELGIPEAGYNLGIGSGFHGCQTGRMLEKIEGLLLDIKPDLVLVYGDTNSTLAGALAAAKLHIPVAHVEAGLRSYNRAMPEEVNRVLTDHCSDLLFAPTETAVNNLYREGVVGSRVKLVGDVMFDAALHFAEKADKHSIVLEKLGLRGKQFILSTVHRAENTDNRERLRIIFEGLYRVASEYPVVLPMHPRTKAALVREGLLKDTLAKLIVIEPLGYLDMIMLEKNAALIATDSGGVQKEAFFYRVPCITLRDETEWVELVDAGWNSLYQITGEFDILRMVNARLCTTGESANLYGDGNAAGKIVSEIVSLYSER
jgi:UDP-GlcNAc3NAcA epimerase